MIPSTTPTIIINLDSDISGCDELELSIRCLNKHVIYTKDDLSISDDGMAVSITLPQDTTIEFADNSVVEMQLRVKQNSKVYSTKILKTTTEELLNREVL